MLLNNVFIKAPNFFCCGVFFGFLSTGLINPITQAAMLPGHIGQNGKHFSKIAASRPYARNDNFGTTLAKVCLFLFRLEYCLQNVKLM